MIFYYKCLTPTTFEAQEYESDRNLIIKALNKKKLKFCIYGSTFLAAYEIRKTVYNEVFLGLKTKRLYNIFTTDTSPLTIKTAR